MSKSHIESIFNSMIDDVSYIKLTTYNRNKVKSSSN